jgi:hypothetical protein
MNAASGRDRRATVLAILVVIMPLLALVPKYFLIQRELGDSGQKIAATGFGFGDYAGSLLTSGEFRSCSRQPFTPCQPERCSYATRMPVLPLLYAGLAHLVGENSAPIAFFKCLLTAIVLAGMLAVLVRDVRPSLVGVVVLYMLYFGPQALKHGASIVYEEGLLLDLELGLAIAISYLLRPALAATDSRRVVMGFAALAIVVLMYFVKTTALLMLVVVVGIFLARARAGWRLNLAAAALILVPFAAWGIHTASSSGAVHLSSSWNGENLFRGYNSDSVAIYPQISLDRIFDSPSAVLDDGTTVPLGDYLHHQQCFAGEWAWNDSYSHRAITWLEGHPLRTGLFLMHKLWVTLVEIRHTPYHVSATDKRPDYPRAVELAMLVWMAVARLISFVLICRLVLEIAGERRSDALWMLALLGAAFAPYIIVFGYQRHVVPLLVMAGGLLVARYLVEPRHACVTVHLPCIVT